MLTSRAFQCCFNTLSTPPQRLEITRQGIFPGSIPLHLFSSFLNANALSLILLPPYSITKEIADVYPLDIYYSR